MKSLFNTEILDEVVSRINLLNPQSQQQWGKMNVAQMLAHCKDAFKVPLSETKMPRSIMGF